MKIEEYQIKPIFSSDDYPAQLKELREKLASDINLLPCPVNTDDDKWEYRNFYVNIYKYYFLLVDEALMQATVSTITDNSEQEQNGWFIYPRKFSISLGNSYDYHSIDEYYSAVYSKYFNNFFSFTLTDPRITGFFVEAKKSYKNGCYYACACSLLPIVEHYTRRLSGYDGESKYNNHNALDNVANELLGRTWVRGSSLKQLSDEYKRIFNFMNTTYYKKSMQVENEPDVLCRNRLLHGILTRDVSATDCLKLFLIIRAQSYLDHFKLWCDKLLQYHHLVLKTEDRIVYGEEEYTKMMQDISDFITKGSKNDD